MIRVYAYSSNVFVYMVKLVQDDILLYRLICQGDREAFRYLFDKYFVPLCRFGILYLNDKQEVEQVAIDIFVYLWENSERVDIKLSFKAYLFNSMRNKCLNILRDRKETCTLEEIGVVSSDEYPFLEIEELTYLIQCAVLSLPEKCREVFQKSRSEHLSYQEIADDMQISVKTVETQISKALKRIKEFLGKKYYFLF